MALHPVIQAALVAGAGQLPYSAMPISEARAQAMLPYRGRQQTLAVGHVHDLVVPNPQAPIPVRVYCPFGPGPHPVLVFFHGSGFVVLGLDSHDDLCRRLCVGAACVVVSVDYRLAPENKFPAAPDDCLAATRWVAAHAAAWGGDGARLALAGDSAGACLAAVTAMCLRDQGGPAVAAQVLFYPVTNHPTPAPASYAQFGSGYGLTAQGMCWFWDQYLATAADAADPRASPLRMPSCADLPPAFVMVAEFDVLRDEGEAFAARLADAGVPVRASRAAGMNHGFLKYADAIEQVAQAIDDACAWLVAQWRQAAVPPAASPDVLPAGGLPLSVRPTHSA